MQCFNQCQQKHYQAKSFGSKREWITFKNTKVKRGQKRYFLKVDLKYLNQKMNYSKCFQNELYKTCTSPHWRTHFIQKYIQTHIFIVNSYVIQDKHRARTRKCRDSDLQPRMFPVSWNILLFISQRIYDQKRLFSEPRSFCQQLHYPWCYAIV